MPKPDGTMTFEEWLEEEAKTVQFDEGDSPEKLLKLGKEFLEEEVRKEEEKLRARRLRRYSRKKMELNNMRKIENPKKIKRQYWLWVTRPEYYLEENGTDRECLNPRNRIDSGSWWTCHKDTRKGDLTPLLH